MSPKLVSVRPGHELQRLSDAGDLLVLAESFQVTSESTDRLLACPGRELIRPDVRWRQAHTLVPQVCHGVRLRFARSPRSPALRLGSRPAAP